MSEYRCETCDGTSTQCYRCDNIIGETSDGEPIRCGGDLAAQSPEVVDEKPVRPVDDN